MTRISYLTNEKVKEKEFAREEQTIFLLINKWTMDSEN